MSLLVSVVLTRVRSTLLDAAKAAWSDDELISYLNGGITQIIAIKPDAYVKRTSLTLVGASAQSLPSDGILLLGANYNAAGSSITIQPMDEFIRVHPTWADDPAGTVRYILYDPRAPGVFYTYPQAPVGAAIFIWYGALPARLSALGDAIALPDYWETALWAYICALAYAKNSKRQDFAKSDEMMKLFMQTVALHTPAKMALSAKADIRGVT